MRVGNLKQLADTRRRRRRRVGAREAPNPYGAGGVEVGAQKLDARVEHAAPLEEVGGGQQRAHIRRVDSEHGAVGELDKRFESARIHDGAADSDLICVFGGEGKIPSI